MTAARSSDDRSDLPSRIILPAHVAYAPLMAELAHSSPVVTKELEVYAGDQPPPDYGLDLEVDGLDRFATGHGFDRFHLYGQSFGGALALAYLARHPDRVASVSLNEPATDFSDADRAAIAAQQLSDGPEDQRMQQFVRPGVELPPPPPPSGDPEMAKRPAGVPAGIRAVDAYRVDADDLRRYRGRLTDRRGTGPGVRGVGDTSGIGAGPCLVVRRSRGPAGPCAGSSRTPTSGSRR